MGLSGASLFSTGTPDSRFWVELELELEAELNWNQSWTEPELDMRLWDRSWTGPEPDRAGAGTGTGTELGP